MTEIKNETHYLNIGTEKLCLFVPMSVHLINELKKKPSLYYAVEEFLFSVEGGYYGMGVFTLSQMLNLFGSHDRGKRNDVAHEFLLKQPKRADYEELRRKFEETAENQQEREASRYDSKEEYNAKIHDLWEGFIQELSD